MNEVKTGGHWYEERLYVLRTLDDLKAESKRQLESAAADRAALIEKGARDINSAHEKIRVLERSRHSLLLKNWALTLMLSSAGAVAFELIKALLHGWKP